MSGYTPGLSIRCGKWLITNFKGLKKEGGGGGGAIMVPPLH